MIRSKEYSAVFHEIASPDPFEKYEQGSKLIWLAWYDFHRMQRSKYRNGNRQVNRGGGRNGAWDPRVSAGEEGVIKSLAPRKSLPRRGI